MHLEEKRQNSTGTNKGANINDRECCCCQFKRAEGTQVAASMKKRVRTFPSLSIRQDKEFSFCPWSPAPWMHTNPHPCCAFPHSWPSPGNANLRSHPWDPAQGRGAENTNSPSKQKINPALSDDSHLSTRICGWPYMSTNVHLFTLGIFKVRFVYSCSDSSYSYANNKP